MGPEQETRSTERRRRATIEGIWRFDAAEGAVGLYGNAVTRERTEELDSTGGVFARGPVATVNARLAGRLLETSASSLSLDERLNSAAAARPFFRSDRHVLRHVTYCRFSARGNLQGLDLAAWRPAVLALAQS
eukprot:1591508-Pleurochrysis_carterae.AAC.2